MAGSKHHFVLSPSSALWLSPEVPTGKCMQSSIQSPYIYQVWANMCCTNIKPRARYPHYVLSIYSRSHIYTHLPCGRLVAQLKPTEPPYQCYRWYTNVWYGMVTHRGRYFLRWSGGRGGRVEPLPQCHLVVLGRRRQQTVVEGQAVDALTVAPARGARSRLVSSCLNMVPGHKLDMVAFISMQ